MTDDIRPKSPHVKSLNFPVHKIAEFSGSQLTAFIMSQQFPTIDFRDWRLLRSNIRFNVSESNQSLVVFPDEAGTKEDWNIFKSEAHS